MILLNKTTPAQHSAALPPYFSNLSKATSVKEGYILATRRRRHELRIIAFNACAIENSTTAQKKAAIVSLSLFIGISLIPPLIFALIFHRTDFYINASSILGGLAASSTAYFMRKHINRYRVEKIIELVRNYDATDNAVSLNLLSGLQKGLLHEGDVLRWVQYELEIISTQHHPVAVTKPPLTI